MSLIATILLGFTAGPCFAQHIEQGEPRADSMRLVLTWVDPERVIHPTAPLAKEVLSLFETTDVHVDWREYAGNQAPSSTEIELHVHLRLNEPHRWNLGKQAMGVAFQGPAPARRVYVFFPAVARMLGYEPNELRRWLRHRPSAQLNRALARVIVHEVFHAIAPSVPHAEDGLTRATLRRRDLLGEHARVDLAVADIFREELRQLNARLVAAERLASIRSAKDTAGAGPNQ